MGFFKKILGRTISNPQAQQNLQKRTRLVDKTGRIPIGEVQNGQIKNATIEDHFLGFKITRTNPKTGTQVKFLTDESGVLLEKEIYLGAGNSAGIFFPHTRVLYDKIYTKTAGLAGVQPNTIIRDIKVPVFVGANGSRVYFNHTSDGWQKTKIVPMNF